MKNRRSPRKWDCPLRPLKGQVHVFGFRFFSGIESFGRKMDQSPAGP